MSKERNKNNCADFNDCGKSCKQKTLETTEGGFKFLVCEKNDNVKPQNVIIPPNLMADPDIETDTQGNSDSDNGSDHESY